MYIYGASVFLPSISISFICTRSSSDPEKPHACTYLISLSQVGVGKIDELN